MVRPAHPSPPKKKSRRKKSLDYKSEVLGCLACRRWRHICLFGLNLFPELTQGQKGGYGSPDCLLTCGQEQSPHFLEKETGTITCGVSG